MARSTIVKKENFDDGTYNYEKLTLSSGATITRPVSKIAVDPPIKSDRELIEEICTKLGIPL